MELEDKSLNEIIESNNKEELKAYLEYLKYFLNQPLFKRRIYLLTEIKDYIFNHSNNSIIGKYSLNDLYIITQKEIYNNTSKILFPNHHFIFYPSIKYYTAKKNIKCDFSSNIISKGNNYIHYSFFTEDLNSKKKYVSNCAINVEIDFSDVLPNNIRELEDLRKKIDDSYIENNEYFYNISCNLKKNPFKLKELKKVILNKNK